MSIRATMFAFCFAATVTAAPAPFPKTNQADQVFEANSEERVRLLTVYLRSKHVKDAMRGNGHDWPLDSMRLEVNGTRVRVRFEANDAVSAMKTLIAVLTTRLIEEGGTEDQQYARRGKLALLFEYRRRTESMRILQKRGGVTKDELEQEESKQARHEFELEPLKWLKRPGRGGR